MTYPTHAPVVVCTIPLRLVFELDDDDAGLGFHDDVEHRFH